MSCSLCSWLVCLPALMATGSVVWAQDSAASAEDEPKGEVIVVTGSRRPEPLAETTVATEVIDRKKITESGAANLAELLASHPGLDVRPSFRGSEVRMQGLDPTYVLILVDGERAMGRIGGAIDLERFAVDDIERIEIIKGPSSALYGSDALAGVINIITRKSTHPLSASLHSSIGQHGKMDLSTELGATRGLWSGLLSAGWHVGNGYDLDTSDAATTASSFDEKHVAQQISYKPTVRHFVRARAEYLLRNQSGIDESGTGAVFDRSTRTETSSASLGLGWRSESGHRLSGTARVGLWSDQYLIDQRLSDELDRYEKTEERLGELRIQHDRLFSDRHYLSVGIDGLAETLEADRIHSDGSRQRVGVFAQHEWTVFEEPYLVLSPGIRVDLDTQFGRHSTPKLALRWDIRESLKARTSYGRGFRAPNFRELLLFFENPAVGYRVQGNADLRPETSHGANAGLEAKLHTNLWATLSVFYNDIDNLITTDLVEVDALDGTQVFGYVNINSARTRGVETLLKAKPVPGWEFEIGYSFTDTLDREEGRALPGRAKHRGTIQSTYRMPGTSVRASVRGAVYGSRVFFQQDIALAASPYADLSFRLAGDITEFFSLFVGVSNILDAGDPQLLPMPPRTFYGGMTATYN